MEKEGCLESYKLTVQYSRVLSYMENCGLPINEEKWLSKMKSDQKELEEAKLEVENYIYNTLPKYREIQTSLFESNDGKIMINLDSPMQMIPVFEDLGINTTDSKGKKSIKKDVIRKTPHEFLSVWLAYQEASHTVSTFGKTVADKIVDGRIYTSFNPLLDTSRISTRKNNINFLNFPANKKTRECFCLLYTSPSPRD